MSATQVTEATVKELCDVAQLAVELAKKAGADDAEVLVRDGSELTAKVRLGEPELVQEAGSRALGLRVLKGVNLIGNGPDVLRRVDMLGKDYQLSDGIWTCGKDGQSVPVNVGTPTVRIASITVGGTQA